MTITKKYYVFMTAGYISGLAAESLNRLFIAKPFFLLHTRRLKYS
jgi:hypothetical protein